MLAFSEFGPATAGRLLLPGRRRLMTGFAEEVVFRGVALQALLRAGPAGGGPRPRSSACAPCANLVSGADPSRPACRSSSRACSASPPRRRAW
ncbi:MAG: hypothetical protein IPM94_10810 [bacterium]|nr:hypothetical protein [bacterium]